MDNCCHWGNWKIAEITPKFTRPVLRTRIFVRWKHYPKYRPIFSTWKIPNGSVPGLLRQGFWLHRTAHVWGLLHCTPQLYPKNKITMQRFGDLHRFCSKLNFVPLLHSRTRYIWIFASCQFWRGSCKTSGDKPRNISNFTLNRRRHRYFTPPATFEAPRNLQELSDEEWASSAMQKFQGGCVNP
jgi:hypothetical protein